MVTSLASSGNLLIKLKEPLGDTENIFPWEDLTFFSEKPSIDSKSMLSNSDILFFLIVTSSEI